MGVSINWGTPRSLDGLFQGKSHLEMDDDWGPMTQESSIYIHIPQIYGSNSQIFCILHPLGLKSSGDPVSVLSVFGFFSLGHQFCISPARNISLKVCFVWPPFRCEKIHQSRSFIHQECGFVAISWILMILMVYTSDVYKLQIPKMMEPFMWRENKKASESFGNSKVCEATVVSWPKPSQLGSGASVPPCSNPWICWKPKSKIFKKYSPKQIPQVVTTSGKINQKSLEQIEESEGLVYMFSIPSCGSAICTSTRSGPAALTESPRGT